MSSGSTRPPSLNDGTNQDAARPAAPTVSTHEGEPSMAQILAALVNTQALLANTLSRSPATTSPIQIHSTRTTSPRQVNCFLHSTGGTLPIVSGTANNRSVRVCIDSGANLSIMSATALTDDIPTHAWVSCENIEVLNRSICPTLAATLDVTLGTTNVRLEDVVVTELPSGIDLILGSDWRRVANVDVTFHTSNVVTIVPVKPSGKFSSSEVPPPKQGTPHRTGKTLIATFCRQSD
ncbi:hypothetical protein HPB51_026313 [Rhipicephalus microplus]|uniref:Peptidase A2 domain-containing protein n=1 Tax=Rhipicephalus microplus TaxID=6941 RepID=A0A9J6D410_RHIMP|nr:hypothetical protein HPB51_026313 [Rhipicephalus microplus]